VVYKSKGSKSEKIKFSISGSFQNISVQIYDFFKFVGVATFWGRSIGIDENYTLQLKMFCTSQSFGGLEGVRVGVTCLRNKLAFHRKTRKLNLKSHPSSFNSFRDPSVHMDRRTWIDRLV